MNQRNLVYLLGTAVVLAALYVFAIPGESRQGGREERPLFGDVDGQAVSKITLEQNDQVLVLENKGGIWTLPTRSGYPADSGKIRALLLKIFDLNVSQLVPGGEGSFDKLGVSDEALKRGFSRVKLYDASGKELGGLRLGEARKSKERTPSGLLSGQYVRRDGENAVYLLGTPVIVSLTLPSWLDAGVVNVLPSALHSITQVKHGAASEEVLFELVPPAAPQKAVAFDLKGGLPAGKSLQEGVLTQIASGLENVRLSDVFTPEAEEVKDAVFDLVSYYKTNTGLVYQISTAEKNERYFMKIAVQFDQALADTLKADYEKRKAAAEQVAAIAKAAATPSPSAAPADPNASPSPSPSPTPVPAPIMPELKLSNAEDAKKLSAQFAPWVYELPVYQARKLRNTRKELIEPPPAPPKDPSAPGGMPQGMPAGMDEAMMGMPGGDE